MLTPFDDIDVPEFVIDSSAIIDGAFVMSGWVELGVHHDHRGHSFGRHAVEVRVPHAEGFTLDDCTETGILVVNAVTETATGIRLEGEAACTVAVATSIPSHAEFYVNETPSFVSRRGSWATSSR